MSRYHPGFRRRKQESQPLFWGISLGSAVINAIDPPGVVESRERRRSLMLSAALSLEQPLPAQLDAYHQLPDDNAPQTDLTAE